MSGIGSVGGIGAMGGAGLGGAGGGIVSGLSGLDGLGGAAGQAGFGGHGLLPVHAGGQCAGGDGPSALVSISDAGCGMGAAADKLSEALMALILLKLMEQMSAAST